jgi:hypothetical protein
VWFLVRGIKKSKKHAKKSVYQVGMTWRFGRISGDYMGRIHSAYDVWVFHMMIIVRCWELKLKNSRFRYYAHLQLHDVRFTCETDGKIYFNYIYFFNLLLFINIFNWQNFYLAGYGSWSSPMKLFMEMMIAKKRCNNSSTAEFNTL